MKTLDSYKSLKYPIELTESDDGVVASNPDLPGCHSFGETIPDAIRNLEEVRTLWLEGYVKRYGSAPEPRDDEDYSGKFVVRVPKSLHRDLEKTARREGTSLNQLVVSLLARGVTSRQSEMASSQLCRTIEKMRDQFAMVCEAPHEFSGFAETGNDIRYSVNSYSKKKRLFEHRSRAAAVTSIPLLIGDDEALVFTDINFPGQFASKLKTTGKAR